MSRRFGRREFVLKAIGGAVCLPIAASCAGSSPADGTDSSAPDVADEGGAETSPPDTEGDPSDTEEQADLAVEEDVPAVEPFTLDAVPHDEKVFPSVVQAGSPTATSMVLWCYTTEPDTMILAWPEGGGVDSVRSFPVSAAAQYAKLRITDLTPGTQYAYAFVTGQADAPVARSLLGRFRTAPDASTSPVVVAAATSCTKDWYKPYPALSLMAERGFDVFCHLGDMSYNDKATTLPEYRAEWLATLAVPGYRDLLPSGSTIQTWDDHEIANGEWSSIPAEQLAAGKQAFFEALPLLPEVPGRVWTNYRYGQTVEFFVLDCRSERRPETRKTPQAELISPAQLSWLTSGLRDSPCTFKVVMNSVPMAQFPVIWPTNDTWAGYAAQRETLLDTITSNKVTGVLFLSGDHHFGSVHRLETSGPRADLWEVLAGPGASSPNPLVGLVTVSPETKESTIPAAQFDYASIEHAGTFLTFDPSANTIHVQFVHAATGDTLFEKTLSTS